MATVNSVILKHQKKQDGTWNVKIRVTHGNQSAYIDTSHFVGSNQIHLKATAKNKAYTLKDQYIIDLINPVLADYRRQISEMSGRVDVMTAKEIAAQLGKPTEQPPVDFGQFCLDQIAALRGLGKLKSAASMQTVYNSLVDFFGTDRIAANDITANMLRSYESYLRTPRTLVRRNQRGGTTTITSKPLGAGVHNYLRDLRVLFNACRFRYNDEDRGIIRIPHYPFSKFKVTEAPAPEKRNLTIEQIRLIRDVKLKSGGRAELARDLFMLSFYLCGMNAVDFYSKPAIKRGRLEYSRSKTKGRRKDKAFISIKLIPEAKELWNKAVPSLADRYADIGNLNKAISKGLGKVMDAINEEAKDTVLPKLEFYHARHSFGNLARNKCRFSKDDVALALNHVDQNRKTTDKYIAPDWSIVDEVQSKVIRLLDASEAPAEEKE